jgi:hypothetical protein
MGHIKIKDAENNRRVRIKGVYPFRVNFKSLGVPIGGSSSGAAIGIAVIGSTFYIR